MKLPSKTLIEFIIPKLDGARFGVDSESRDYAVFSIGRILGDDVRWMVLTRGKVNRAEFIVNVTHHPTIKLMSVELADAFDAAISREFPGATTPSEREIQLLLKSIGVTK